MQTAACLSAVLAEIPPNKVEFRKSPFSKDLFSKQHDGDAVGGALHRLSFTLKARASGFLMRECKNGN